MANTTGKKWGGRKKGTPNKPTGDIFETVKNKNCNVIEFFCDVINGDFKSLGYESNVMTKLVGDNAITEDVITLEHRIKAARELAQYLYPKRKAIEHTGKDGTDLFLDRLLNAEKRLEEKKDVSSRNE